MTINENGNKIEKILDNHSKKLEYIISLLLKEDRNKEIKKLLEKNKNLELENENLKKQIEQYKKDIKNYIEILKKNDEKNSLKENDIDNKDKNLYKNSNKTKNN